MAVLPELELPTGTMLCDAVVTMASRRASSACSSLYWASCRSLSFSSIVVLSSCWSLPLLPGSKCGIDPWPLLLYSGALAPAAACCWLLERAGDGCV